MTSCFMIPKLRHTIGGKRKVYKNLECLKNVSGKLVPRKYSSRSSESYTPDLEMRILKVINTTDKAFYDIHVFFNDTKT